MSDKILNSSSFVENIIDNTILSTTNNILEEFVKALPVGSLLTSGLDVFKNYQTRKKIQQILYFVEEAQNLQAGKIFEIFSKQDNLEIGSELLNALDKTYLILQSQMLARAAILYDANEIGQTQFLRYAHIIPKFTSFLLKQLEHCYLIFQKIKMIKISD